MWLMNTDTRELLAELRQDHRNMARVLELMDGIVTEMETPSTTPRKTSFTSSCGRIDLT